MKTAKEARQCYECLQPIAVGDHVIENEWGVDAHAECFGRCDSYGERIDKDGIAERHAQSENTDPTELAGETGRAARPLVDQHRQQIAAAVTAITSRKRSTKLRDVFAADLRQEGTDR